MLQTLINQYIAGDDTSQAISDEIKTSGSSIVVLVQGLGEFITREDDTVRSRALSCLSSVVTKLVDSLSSQQLDVITKFLCDRMKDEDSVGEVIQGILPIASSKNTPFSSIDSICESLCAVKTSSYPQQTRYVFFLVLKAIIEGPAATVEKNKATSSDASVGGTDMNQATLPTSHLVSINDLFVKAFLNVASGEKDPRNLIESFYLNEKIQQKLNVSKYIEDLFDVTFCYFPIKFTPPKNDPYGITALDLKLALRKCFTVPPGLLAQFSIPALIEKLNSTSDEVKIDVFETLEAAITSFDAPTADSVWEEVWNGLKYEVLHGSDSGLSDYAIAVLRALAHSTSPSALEMLAQRVTVECNEKMKDIQHKLALPAVRLAAGIAGANEKSFELIAAGTLSPLLDLASSPENLSSAQKRHLLQMVAVYVGESRRYTQAMLRYKDQVYVFASRCLLASPISEVTLRELAIDCLSDMCDIRTTPELLTENERTMAVQHITSAIIVSDASDQLCATAIKDLIKIEKSDSKVIFDVVFPTILAALPSVADTADDSNGYQVGVSNKPPRVLLSYLSDLCFTRSAYSQLAVRLLNKADGAVDVKDSKYRGLLVRTMLSITKSLLEKKEDLSLYLDKISTQLNGIVYRIGSTDNEVILAAALLANLTVANLTDSKKRSFVSSTLSKFDLEKGPSAFMAIHSFVLVASPVEMWPTKQPLELVDVLTKQVALSSDTFIRTNGYLRALASLTNRVKDIEGLQEFLDKLYASQNPSDLEVLFWMVKGLLLRMDASSTKWLERLTLCLEDKERGEIAGRLFGVLVSDDVVVNVKSGLTVRLLYRQRAFSVVVPLILRISSSGDRANKVHCMVALSGLLRYLPSKVLVGQVSQILPLLLESLDLNDATIQEATIQTIQSISVDSSGTLDKYLDSFVPRILSLAVNGGHAVRLACVKSLSQLATICNAGGYKERIIKTLGKVLDDKKRDVRKEAAMTRQKYYDLE